MLFPEFYLHRYRFNLSMQEPVNLPEYKGSALRGFFDNALKSLVCIIKKTDCSICILKDRCVYFYLFESGKDTDNKPLPYVLSPPLDPERKIESGEDIVFDITLIGRANDYFPHIAAAFIEKGGRGFKKGRGKFSLKGIEAIGPDGKAFKIFDHWQQTLAGNRCRITAADFIEPVQDVTALTVHFETHTRIKKDKHLVNKPPSFHIIIESLLRRASLLNNLHCGGEIADLSARLDGAKAINISSSRITWYDFERYSARQRREMILGGFRGWAAYEGPLNMYIPLLRLGEFINVGKLTTMGLGKIRIQM